MSDAEINQQGLYPWKKTKVSVEVPADVSEAQAREFRNQYPDFNIKSPDKITFEVKPTLNTAYGSVIRVQDLMVLKILHWNKWKKPIYFAVTVAKSNMLSELQDFMRMDGLALKIVPFKNWKISADRLEKNLIDIYQYRGLQDPSVYYDRNIIGLIQNYRTGFLQLSEYYSQSKQTEKIKYLMAEMEERVPSSVIPWTNRYLKLIRDSYRLVSQEIDVDSIFGQNYNEQELSVIGENLLRMQYFDQSSEIFESLYQSNPNNVKALSLLINIYERAAKYERGISHLEKWLGRYPNDTEARKKLNLFKEKM
jgi:tetratricopeptide (TPR) repeat protein